MRTSCKSLLISLKRDSLLSAQLKSFLSLISNPVDDDDDDDNDDDAIVVRIILLLQLAEK